MKLCNRHTLLNYNIIAHYMSSRQYNPILLLSSNNPILINDEGVKQVSISHINTVSNVAPLPSHSRNDSLTKILYSKFIVKGVTPINKDAIINRLKGQPQIEKRRKETRKTTNCTKQMIVKQNYSRQELVELGRKSKYQERVFDQRSINYGTQSNYQKNASSLKKRPQSAFQRSYSAKHINRPQTALQLSSKVNAITKPESAIFQRSSSESKLSRPKTAVSRQHSVQRNNKLCYDACLTDVNSQFIKISDQPHPAIKPINYIQKNKKSVSIKKQGFYITSADIPNNSLIRTVKKRQQSNFEELALPKSRQTVTIKQKQLIKAKQRQFLNYMKQNMPSQYIECLNYLSSIDQSNQQQSMALKQISLGKQENIMELSEAEMQEINICNYFQDFYNKCLDVEYGIKRAERKREYKKIELSILNIHERQQILQIYQEMILLRQNGQEYSHLNNSIKNIVKPLQFFKQLKPQMIKNIFQMNYRIQKISEGQFVIHNQANVNNVFVIISGSVSKHNCNKQQEENTYAKSITPPKFFKTLFDGQIFGIPDKSHDKKLNYSIKTVEPCILMSFPYSLYSRAVSSNQNIEDRIQLLKHIFTNINGIGKLSVQDYQSIAYQMESFNYQAQQIVFREGDDCSQLLIVASGKAEICFQSIIKRKKQKINSLSKKVEDTRPQISINQMRRTNLKDYQLLRQNAEQLQYYWHQTQEQKIRGDVLNWRFFHKKICQNNQIKQQKLPYSIMSLHDNTRIYMLSPEKLSALSDHVRINIQENTKKHFGKDKIIRNQSQLDQWEQYKRKLCASFRAAKIPSR